MMQYDVKAFAAKNSGTAINYRTRLKGLVVAPATASARNMCIADPTVLKSGTWSRTGTTVTVTINNHGLANGQRVFLDILTVSPTTPTMRDGVYAVANVATNTFEVTSAVSGSSTGTLTMYTNLLVEIDTYNTVDLPIRLPGEGILCENGIYVGLGASVTATVFYG
jgi:hypothetical protein